MNPEYCPRCGVKIIRDSTLGHDCVNNHSFCGTNMSTPHNNWREEFESYFLNEDRFSSKGIFHSKYDNGKIGYMVEDLIAFIVKVEQEAIKRTLLGVIDGIKNTMMLGTIEMNEGVVVLLGVMDDFLQTKLSEVNKQTNA